MTPLGCRLWFLATFAYATLMNTIPICGDNVVSGVEECDGSLHCTNCYCDDGYNAYNGSCVPKCEVEGCLSSCISPNECSICRTPAYQSDCHRCGDGFYPEGFLECVPFDFKYVSTCHKVLYETQRKTVQTIELSSSLETSPLVFDMYKEDFVLTQESCGFTFDKTVSYVKGIWFELTVTESGYYAFDTDMLFAQENIDYYTLQFIEFGFDSVLSIQDVCPSTNESYNVHCISYNDGLRSLIKSASLVTFLRQQSYFLHVFGHYGTVPTSDIKMFVHKMSHPCDERKRVLSWNDINEVRVVTVNTANSITSSTICSTRQEKGDWYLIPGSEKTLLVSTCGDDPALDTYIQLIRVPSTKNGEIKSCIDQSAECVQYSDRGCGSNARLIERLSDGYYYYIFISATLIIQFNVTFKSVCPYNCVNGYCSTAIGGCICNPGFIKRDEMCTSCGNGVLDFDEECDLSVTDEYPRHCSKSTCMCNYGYRPIAINNVTRCALPTCGNNIIEDYEECDSGVGCVHCECVNGYLPYSTPHTNCLVTTCGNNKVDPGEQCDGTVGCFECECIKGYHRKGFNCQKDNYFLYYIYLIAVVYSIYIIAFFILLTYFVIKYKQINDVIAFEKQDEGQELVIGTNEELDKSKTFYLNLPNEFFDVTPRVINFSQDNARVEVGKITERMCLVTNYSDESMKFAFYATSDKKFQIAFRPQKGELKKHSEILVKMRIVLQCTTIIHESVYISASFSRFKKLLRTTSFVTKSQKSDSKRQPSDKLTNNSFSSHSTRTSFSSENTDINYLVKKPKAFYTYITIEAQSQLSTRLDWDELFLFQPPIGQGTFGIVFRATWRQQEVAVKMVKTDQDSAHNLMPSFEKEVELLETMRSPYIVTFIGSCVAEDCLSLVTEFCTFGSLKKFIKENPVNAAMKIRCCLDVAKGMAYLHNNNVTHRDLKPDNCLVVNDNPNSDVVVKVSDFGTSLQFIENCKTSSTREVGTPVYMAPEVLTSNILHGKSDVFSYAITILEIWIGKCPYSPLLFPDNESIWNFVTSGKRLEIPATCPYSRIIKKCWRSKENRRPAFTAIETYFLALLKNEKTSNTVVDVVQKGEDDDVSMSCIYKTVVLTDNSPPVSVVQRSKTLV
ncbi:serine-threonine protein kinase, putative [Entamoeba invadens IP1]|uniref:serine-threonine protein kinase, putative n=1 Tax=Entamoeba invadens IP1 TaxID=370355 RepID=UPI0002C3E8AC|nr:serine-threonine protein kinase, putative [Entamoeba invadens IP1]ELP94224.1 serine-threonine protein kinase, putative [Entamoeba invadens IP1]|eukprot:XP_004260995.1 serine-threonine protein kinase, putative [Entamoeba invadens IP1]